MAAVANKVVIGNDVDNPILTFENATIREISSETAVSLIGDELFIDQLVPICEYEVWVPRIYKPTDAEGIVSTDGEIYCTRMNYDLRKLPYGTKITYYYDDYPGGEFFCKHVERVGKTQYKITAISAIGLMDKQFHMGGIYHGEYFADVLREITGPDYDYSVDGVVATQRVFGWLPYSTRRKNLHQLLIAFGVNIVKGDNGKMFFTFLDAVDPEPVPSYRVFSGGSVVYDEPASHLEVTEHGYHYISDVDEVVLFDNTTDEMVEHSLVTFDEPIYPDSIYAVIPEDEGAEPLTVHEVGVNYAYVTGIGVLKGKPYMHVSRILTADNENAQVERVVKVEEATLISVMNSQQCLDRLSSYYFHATTVKEDIRVEYEKAGGRYIINNAYDEQLTGFISKMSTRYSSFRRGSCEIIQNYNPNGIGASYQDSIIIPLPENESVTWNIPSSVFDHEKPTIRVVLIGKGYTGVTGKDGKRAPYVDHHGLIVEHAGYGGEGGEGGKGGLGGRVQIVTIDPIGLDHIRVYNSDYHSLLEAGSWTFSSEDGASRVYGYYDPFTDTMYGVRGKDGTNGGKGGDGDYFSHDHSDQNTAQPGEDVVYEGVKYTGGQAGGRSDMNGAEGGISSNLHIYVSGRGGGGAAAGSNGYAPAAPKAGMPPEGNGNGFFGPGGAGANAVPASPPEDHWGNGGYGGNGGGGEGAMAIRHYWNEVFSSVIAEEGTGSSGHGGKGSVGSEGRWGCAIIYY